MKAELRPLDGGEPIRIDRDLVLVGRRRCCEIRLRDTTVSKLHCILAKTDGLLLLRDLGSTNGCRVNGRRVRRGMILPNDILTIANYEFRVCLAPTSELLRVDPSHPAAGPAHDRSIPKSKSSGSFSLRSVRQPKMVRPRPPGRLADRDATPADSVESSSR